MTDDDERHAGETVLDGVSFAVAVLTAYAEANADATDAKMLRDELVMHLAERGEETLMGAFVGMSALASTLVAHLAAARGVTPLEVIQKTALAFAVVDPDDLEDS